MLTTATHDHKRGEDVRARLAVLSERPDIWAKRVRRWGELNQPLSARVELLDLYPLYQTLVGAWPLDLGVNDPGPLDAFGQRVMGWWRKALREAKLNSSWAAPDEDYEAACESFLKAALNPDRSAAFLGDLYGFVEEIAPAGALNGLVQALLRCTAPGMADLYQGCEFWDFSLVDPDNRRPVDYVARCAALGQPGSAGEQLAGWRDGRVKQRLIADLLYLRRRWPDVFADGDYEPLTINGPVGGGATLIAFVRRRQGRAVLVAAPLRVAASVRKEDLRLSPATFEGAVVRIPADLAGKRAHDVLAGGSVVLAPEMKVSSLFERTPFACLAIG